MEKKNKYLKIIFTFSLIGTLFAGYLTVSKLLGACAIKEGCPYFLGLPSCMYGLVMYIIILVASSLILFKDCKKVELMKKIIFTTGLVGVIFALYSSVKEIMYPNCLNGVCEYTLGMPICIYGLIMFTIVFITTVLMKKADRKTISSKPVEEMPKQETIKVVAKKPQRKKAAAKKTKKVSKKKK